MNAEINSHITSVLNPASGVIKAASIGTLILDKAQVDPSKIQIICPEITETLDHFDPNA